MLSTPAQRKRSRVAEILSEVETIGPNLAEVARRLGKPKESVTYAFRTNIEKNGYRIQARTNRGAVGLRDVAILADLAPEYATRAADLFDHTDKWYLNGFNMTIPDGRFFMLFTLPDRNYDEFPKLVEAMQRVGLITKVHRTLHFENRKHRAMHADTFDFKRARWEFDWSQLRSEPAPEMQPRSARQEVDLIDVKMLGNFFVDASWPINDIAKRIGISSKTAYRHAQHIQERNLIQSYGVNWLKTHMHDDLVTAHTPKHKYVFTNVNVLGVSSSELAWLREKMNTLPFLWIEYTGQDYAAELAVPLELMVETMSYFREVLEPVADRANTYMTDAAAARAYALPWKVFDDSRGDWTFDIDAQMAFLEARMKSALKEKPAGR